MAKHISHTHMTSGKVAALATTIAAGSIVATPATANPQVANGYDPLAITAKAISWGSNFNEASSVSDLAGWVGPDGSTCGTFNFTDVTCLADYGISLQDDGNGGSALSLTGADAAVIAVHGRTPVYDISEPVENVVIALSHEAIPGARRESGALVPGDLGEPTEDFTSSVDLKLSAEPTGEDYQQKVLLGSSSVYFTYTGTMADRITFRTVVPVPGQPDRYDYNQTLAPNFTGNLPTDIWLTYSVSYTAATQELVHTLVSRDDGAATINESVTITGAFPYLLETPLTGIVDVPLQAGDDSYASTLELDNYEASDGFFVYETNYTPLVYDANDGLGPQSYDNTGFIYYLAPFIEVNGEWVPSNAIPVFPSNGELLRSVDGAIGNDLNMSLINAPVGNGSLLYTVIHHEDEAMIDAFAAASNITQVAHFEDVFVADGVGNDYIVENNDDDDSTPPTVPPTPVCGAAPFAVLLFGSLLGGLRRRARG